MVVLEILKLRGFRSASSPARGRAPPRGEVDAGVARELETGSFAALDPETGEFRAIDPETGEFEASHRAVSVRRATPAVSAALPRH